MRGRSLWRSVLTPDLSSGLLDVFLGRSRAVRSLSSSYDCSRNNTNDNHKAEEKRQVPDTLPKRMADLVSRIDPFAAAFGKKVENTQRNDAKQPGCPGATGQ